MSETTKNKTASNENASVIPNSEKISYYSYFIGQNVIYIFITSFINVYFVMKLGIAAATVGNILLIARVWDAVNDPMLSVLVEKSKLKGGKFKPWINTVAILVPLSTVLIFSFTDFLVDASTPAKIAYASITYILWGMLYTISDAPAFALATVMTPVPNERNTLISLARTLSFVGILFGMIAAMPLVEASSWFVASIVMAAVGFFLMLQVRRCKERVQSTQNSPTLKEIVSAIFSNKYLVIIVVTMVFWWGLNFGNAIAPMIAADIFGDASLTSIIMMVSMLPMMVVMPLTPMLIKKFGKINLFKFGLVISLILSLVRYFAGYQNFTLFIIISAVQGLLTGFSMILPSLFFADCIEYYFYKTGARFEAATFAAQTFANKALGAVAGAGGMWLLAAFGYKEAVGGVAQVQSQQVVDGIWITYNIGPAVGSLIALVFFWSTYKLSESALADMAKRGAKL